ncbi:hypothetical protein KMU_35760 [Proteus vulgaris]|uniref:hypothetical protein n=1 Tax=Proteus vulgaris TaxID=585 RepID=UPI002556A37C|nr:hypothetical protein [Proteus vulgaris]GLX65534.1 hypothetical protein KMU_35760 [Proteus vulgaris]
MINLPLHIERLRIVSLDQAALAIAGLAGKVNNVEEAVSGNYTGHEIASRYREIIIQAIKLKEINPLQVLVSPSYYSDLPFNSKEIIDNDKVTINSPIIDANFYAKDIWGWVAKELDSESQSVLMNAQLKEKQLSEQCDANEWGGFAGKDTALMFIAGLAIALEKTGKPYKHGLKINKSRVAEAAINAINDYGHGTTISDKTLRNLIDEALDMYAQKL